MFYENQIFLKSHNLNHFDKQILNLLSIKECFDLDIIA
jgi:hypothetical protein